MNEEKRNRIIAAVTVNLILLLVILAAVIIYQLVTICVVAENCKKLNAEIEYYITEAERVEDNLDYLKTEEFLMDKAYEYGFVYGK